MNGVGGRTVEEAQRRMSYPEFLRWVAYRNRRGSLHPGMRIERAAALLATIYANSKSKNGGFTIYDFAPHEDESALTIEQAMEQWD